MKFILKIMLMFGMILMIPIVWTIFASFWGICIIWSFLECDASEEPYYIML